MKESACFHSLENVFLWTVPNYTEICIKIAFLSAVLRVIGNFLLFACY